MAFEVSGKLEVIFDTQQVTERFKKREFVMIVQDGMYQEHVKMQLLQDKCDLLNGFSVGDEIKVSFNLKGKPFTKGNETLYFTNLDAWRIEKTGQPAPASQPTATPTARSAANSPAEDVTGVTFEASDDELPF